MEITVRFNLDEMDIKSILAVHKDLNAFVVKACEVELERIIKLEKKEEVKDGTSTKKDGS